MAALQLESYFQHADMFRLFLFDVCLFYVAFRSKCNLTSLLRLRLSETLVGVCQTPDPTGNEARPMLQSILFSPLVLCCHVDSRQEGQQDFVNDCNDCAWLLRYVFISRSAS